MLPPRNDEFWTSCELVGPLMTQSGHRSVRAEYAIEREKGAGIGNWRLKAREIKAYPEPLANRGISRQTSYLAAVAALIAQPTATRKKQSSLIIEWSGQEESNSYL